MTLNDFEPLMIVNFSVFLQFSAAAPISRVNCAKMAGDKPGHSAQAYEFFLA